MQTEMTLVAKGGCRSLTKSDKWPTGNTISDEPLRLLHLLSDIWWQQIYWFSWESNNQIPCRISSFYAEFGNVKIITQRLHNCVLLYVTKIRLINFSTGEWGWALPQKKLNILHEMVHFGAFYVYNGVLGVELPARSRDRARGSGVKLKALKQLYT